MINGEGAGWVSSEVASPDPLDEFQPWRSHQSDFAADVSPVSSSRYSSCGESEFERYCSANSVMGTPSSVGTFHECSDFDFGSLKNFKLGDSSDLDNFTLVGKFDPKNDHSKSSPLAENGSFLKDEISDGNSGLINNVELRQGKMKIEDGLYLNDIRASTSSSLGVHLVDARPMMSLKRGDGLSLSSFSELNGALDEGFCFEDDLGAISTWKESEAVGLTSETVRSKDTANQEANEQDSLSSGVSSSMPIFSAEQKGLASHSSIEQSADGLKVSTSQSAFEFDGKDDKNFSDDEASGRYEHSGDEDSMFGCDTEDEERMNVYHRGNIRHHWRLNLNNNGNSLNMTSTVAFGEQDWDDFMQSVGESNLTSIFLHDTQGQKPQIVESERGNLNSASQTVSRPPNEGVLDQERDMNEVLEAGSHPRGGEKLAVLTKVHSADSIYLSRFEVEHSEDVKEVFATNISSAVEGNDPAKILQTLPCSKILQHKDPLSLIENVETSPLSKFIEDKCALIEQAPIQVTYDVIRCENGCVSSSGVTSAASGNLCTGSNKVADISDGHTPECVERAGFPLEPVSDSTVTHLSLAPALDTKSKIEDLLEDHESHSLPSSSVSGKMETKETTASLLSEICNLKTKVQILELNEFCSEVVHDMEEILLDSNESPATRFVKSSSTNQPQMLLPSRDGGSTASTSFVDDTNLTHFPLRIDQVEVVGTRQKKGDVSFSKRLVGVKEYTVYIIGVRRGKDKWEVEQRYREFCSLYNQLKTVFIRQGLDLPWPWTSVEQESKNIFGNTSSDAIAERSLLIQECLQSVLHFWFLYTLSSPLVLFLSSPKSASSSSTLTQESFFHREKNTEEVSRLGKTISLVVDIRPYKSTKQVLEEQHYTCAGCYKHFSDKKTRIQGFVQTLGWGKPRLCDYSGQLFCSSCHANETAVLPARVLHFWDFSLYSVSQIAKSYLDSIHDQPMLCVSAVNPFLFYKVPTLQHVRNVRRKVCAMIPYVRCPFRGSIYKGLGSRRYLLESIDFFALKDLVDLSKGMFAALPVVMDTISKKILDHITEQCLVCYDTGVPCNARQACPDPSSLIFPFQEDEIERCRSCRLVFHRPCFRKIANCPCGAVLNLKKVTGETNKGSDVLSGEMDQTANALGMEAETKSHPGLFSGLLSMVRPGKSQERERDGGTVVLMGSLPNTSL